MPRFIMSIMLVFAFALPIFAQAKCVDGKCFLPAPATSQWKVIDGHPDNRGLYRDGVYAGDWNIATQQWTPHENGTYGLAVSICPFGVPDSFLRTLPSPAKAAIGQLPPDGVDPKKISKTERHTISGHEVSKTQALNKLGLTSVDGDLVDDSEKLWLLVASPSKEIRERVEKAVLAAPVLADVRHKIRFWSGDGANTEHFLMKDRDSGKPLYPPGEPRVMLIDSKGAVKVSLSHFDEKSSVGALRKAFPDYNPDLDPDGAQKKKDDSPVVKPLGIDRNVLILFAIAVGGVVLYTISQNRGS